MAETNSPPRQYTKTKDQVRAEFVAAAARNDLEPAEVPNTGYSVEQHEQAMLTAVAKHPMKPLGAPLFRQAIAPKK